VNHGAARALAKYATAAAAATSGQLPAGSFDQRAAAIGNLGSANHEPGTGMAGTWSPRQFNKVPLGVKAHYVSRHRPPPPPPLPPPPMSPPLTPPPALHRAPPSPPPSHDSYLLTIIGMICLGVLVCTVVVRNEGCDFDKRALTQSQLTNDDEWDEVPLHNTRRCGCAEQP